MIGPSVPGSIPTEVEVLPYDLLRVDEASIFCYCIISEFHHFGVEVVKLHAAFSSNRGKQHRKKHSAVAITLIVVTHCTCH